MPVKLDSKIFNKAVRAQAISAAVGKSAKVFKEATRRRMVESSPAGKIEERGKQGKGFSRRFRRSKSGQRPAVDTTTLINALADHRTSDQTVIVEVDNKTNPRNGAKAKDYAERLQGKMNRKIMTAEDAKIAQAEFNYRMNRVLGELV
jgi:inosine-uridine nucleoside N-ribohydrolase